MNQDVVLYRFRPVEHGRARWMNFSVLALVLGFLLTGFSGRLFAQTFQAQVTGTVQDPSGAAVPGATVTMVNISTGASVSAISNPNGVYRVLSVPAGNWKLTATAKGFQSFVQSPIVLQVAQVLTLNLHLQVGTVTQEVVASSAPPVLETQTATLGQVVTGRSIANLPLNVRDPMALIALTPGVVIGHSFGAGGGGTDVGRNFFKSDFTVGGGRSGSQEILLDGAPDTTPDVNRGVIDPPVDSVQEFKVQANSYSADFGRTTGGVVNIITKSGSNAFHGEVYDFERNSVFDANNFFNDRSSIKKPSFKRHQFGGNYGGPILHKKLFLFTDFEGLRQGVPMTSISTVPTDLQRQGDFSQTFTSAGKLIQIYDPGSVQQLPDGSYQRSAFANNTIPGNLINPVAAAILKRYPAPNLPGDPVTGQHNYIFASNETTDSNKFDVRVDNDLTQDSHVFVRISHQWDTRVVPGNLPLPIGGGRSTSDKFDQDAVDLTHTFTPNLVSEWQVSFTRALAAQVGLSNGFDLKSLGFAGNYATAAVAQFPELDTSDVTGTSTSGTPILQYQPRNVLAFHGNINWAHGAQIIKAGFESRILDFNEGQNGVPAGQFSFNRQYTQGPNPLQASAVAGYGLADFLLGDASSGQIMSIQPISTRALYHAFYLQDDWTVSSRLTLNLGLRYDLTMGNREKYNRLAYLDLNSPNPQGPLVGLPNLTGMLRWTGDGIKDQQVTDYDDFAPRIGFAYRAGDNTAIRGGYGIFYIPTNVQGLGQGAIEAFRSTPYVSSIDGINPTGVFSNPFPQGILPAVTDRNPLANEGTSISAPLHQNSIGYAQLWSFGVERQMGSVVLGATYWGNKGTRLLTGSWNLDQLPDQYLALGSALNQTVANPFFGVIPSGPLSGPKISRKQSLLPYPQYTGVYATNLMEGNSTYHAFTFSVEKRAGQDLTFMGSYTIAKGIDDIGSPLDVYQRKAEKAVSSFDVPQHLVFSYVYSLPFGRGHKLGGNAGSWLNMVIGGWKYDGIITLQGGQPISISRPSVNNGQSAHLDSPSLAQWFNTSVFSTAPAYTFGNVGPRLADVRTDGVSNVDFVLLKDFTVTGGEHPVRAQFRGEFFNAFNTPQFGAPNGSITSSAFGTISSQANNPRDVQFGLKLMF